MISVKEARRILEEHAPKGRTFNLPLAETRGLILAEDAFATVHVPPFDNSAMDGYAVCNSTETMQWSLAGELPAGTSSSKKMKPGEAIRIFTGSPIPEGADTVIPQELVTVKNGQISCPAGLIPKGANIRSKGSQMLKGQLIVPAGTTISPGTIGLLASSGICKAQVFTPPLAGIIVTGNELREIGQTLKPGQIFNSNAPMLEACLRNLGLHVVQSARVGDHYKETVRLISDFIDHNDVVIISGGISVGDYDYVKKALDSLGAETLMYKLKQRPGKPFYAGKCRNKMVFALPGNPASVLSCFNHYVKPVLKKVMGHQNVWEPEFWGRLSEDVEKKPGLTFFLKGSYQKGEVKVLKGQQSFNLIAFAEANCFFELPEEAEIVKVGTLVPIYPL